jgi:DNA-binding GntR family transcriptional regulator
MKASRRRGRSSSRRSRAPKERASPGHLPNNADGFLYQHVAAELRRRIQSGIYASGHRIPTEAELVGDFGVSTITVRRAVRELTTEGLLFGRQGLGVFVTDTRRIVRSFSSTFTTSMSEDMRRGGYEPSAKERSLGLVGAPVDVASRLGIAEGTRIYRHEKTIYADNEAIGFDTTFLPSRVGDAVRHAMADEFIVGLVGRHGFTVDHMDYRFDGGVLSSDAAEALNLPIGFPVLSVTYTAFDRAGDALFTGRTIARSDRVSYEFCGRPGVHQATPKREPRT